MRFKATICSPFACMPVYRWLLYAAEAGLLTVKDVQVSFRGVPLRSFDAKKLRAMLR